MSRRLRALLATLLAAVLVAGGSSVAWSLWSDTEPRDASVTIGKVAVDISGVEAMTTTFSSAETSMTMPVTLANTDSIPGTATTSVSVVAGTSTELAQAVDVVAWPVGATSDCTDTAMVGSGSVSGTWATLPSLTSQLPAHTSVVWCVRSTPSATAPAPATADVHIGVTLTAGTWTAADMGGFYLNTSAATDPALTCTDHSGNYVDIRWPAGSRPQDTWYGAFIGDTQVGSHAQDYSGFITLAPTDIPSTIATSGTQTVVVKVLDDAGQPTSTVAASGPVTLFTQNDGPAIRCGA